MFYGTVSLFSPWKNRLVQIFRWTMMRNLHESNIAVIYEGKFRGINYSVYQNLFLEFLKRFYFLVYQANLTYALSFLRTLCKRLTSATMRIAETSSKNYCRYVLFCNVECGVQTAGCIDIDWSSWEFWNRLFS